MKPGLLPPGCLRFASRVAAPERLAGDQVERDVDRRPAGGQSRPAWGPSPGHAAALVPADPAAARRQPEGPKRSTRLLSTGTPASASTAVAASANPDEPHPKAVSPPRT